MTGTRRPLGIPPPSPNRRNSSDEEESSEEEVEDVNEEDSETSGSESSIDREIRSFEERNRELAERIREVEEDRLHHVEIQESWRRKIVELEAKLGEMRAVIEVVQGNGAAVLGRNVGLADHELETMNAIERELEYLQRLMAADEGYQAEPEIDADGSNQMDEAQ